MFDKYLSKKAQGVLIMIIGLVLFLNALGFIDRGINCLIIICSLGLMIYGFVQADGYALVQKILRKRNNLPKP